MRNILKGFLAKETISAWSPKQKYIWPLCGAIKCHSVTETVQCHLVLGPARPNHWLPPPLGSVVCACFTAAIPGIAHSWGAALTRFCSASPPTARIRWLAIIGGQGHNPLVSIWETFEGPSEFDRIGWDFSGSHMVRQLLPLPNPAFLPPSLTKLLHVTIHLSLFQGTQSND